ncbi:hypothetical protein ACLQ2N_33585 [Streptomyces sp. DT224]|uniref:hypothetical protein n=1 Tax=Streptomyces sp. DT224 TaxID=3393426 RepID=UPI003CF32E8A
MAESTLPEELLLLAADFTRHNDSLSALNGSSPSNLLTEQTVLTQNLAKSALHAREVLAACPVLPQHRSPRRRRPNSAAGAPGNERGTTPHRRGGHHGRRR